MIDMELDRLIASTSRVTDAEVKEFDLAEAEAALLETIASRSLIASDPAQQAEGHGNRRRLLSLAAVAVAAAVLSGVIFVGVNRGSNDRAIAFAAEVVAVAESAPRLLVNLPNWRVARAEQFTVDRGEINFTDGEANLDVKWFPSSEYVSWVDEVRRSTGAPQSATILLGEEVDVFVYRAPATEQAEIVPDAPRSGDFTALWLDGRHGVEARGEFASLDRFKRAVSALTLVDVDTWLSAMPASVVRPGSRAEAVEAMLIDIPLPPGFDAASLRAGKDRADEVVRDRYHLGAEVTGAVACAWIESWITATDQGDAAGVQRAVKAMATSHDWAILTEMQSKGDWPRVLWEYADALPTDAPIAGGRPLTIREAYRGSLGCGSEQRR